MTGNYIKTNVHNIDTLRKLVRHYEDNKIIFIPNQAGACLKSYLNTVHNCGIRFHNHTIRKL